MKAGQEVTFTEEHMDRMYPSEVQFEEMVYQRGASCDVGPVIGWLDDRNGWVVCIIEVFNPPNNIYQVLK